MFVLVLQHVTRRMTDVESQIASPECGLDSTEDKASVQPSLSERAADARTVRFRRRKAERRAEIARLALRLMAEHGLSEATNTRIADAIGVSEPALYAHFDSRMDILVAAMDVLVERITQWIQLSSNPNMLERVKEIGERHASFIAEELEGFVLPTFEFIASPRRLGLSQRFGQRQLEIIHMVAGLIEEGKSQGTIRQDVDSELAAWELIILAWAEDIARLAGLDQFISDGISLKILDLFLQDMAAAGHETTMAVVSRERESRAGAPQ